MQPHLSPPRHRWVSSLTHSCAVHAHPVFLPDQTLPSKEWKTTEFLPDSAGSFCLGGLVFFMAEVRAITPSCSGYPRHY